MLIKKLYGQLAIRNYNIESILTKYLKSKENDTKRKMNPTISNKM